jgi:hypothetical protein
MQVDKAIEAYAIILILQDFTDPGQQPIRAHLAEERVVRL